MADVRIIEQSEITTLSGGEYLVTDSPTAGTKKITPQVLCKEAGMGDLNNLETTAKGNLVAAINELFGEIDGLDELIGTGIIE